MKKCKVYKSFMIPVSIIAIFVFQSMADTPNFNRYFFGGTGWSYNVSIGAGTSFNNPNMFGTVMIESYGSGTQQCWGFLLDGSETSKEMLKNLQDAIAENKTIQIFADDNKNNGYQQSLGTGYYMLSKILTVAIYN